MKPMIRILWALALAACWLAPVRAENAEDPAPDLKVVGVDNKNPRTLHDYDWPKKLGDTRKFYLENWHDYGSSSRLLRYHPMPQVEYKGMTLGGTVTAAFREIQSFKAGVESFQAELKDGAMMAGRAQGDAPRRYLVSQGWKIAKKLACIYNENLVPASNLLYDGSELGNQNLEILLIIAGKQVGLPQAATIANFQTQLQMIEQVQAEHNKAVAMRAQVPGLLQKGLSDMAELVPMIEEYDRAYAEYQGGMGRKTLRLVSPAAKLAASAAMGVRQAADIGQLAYQVQGVAEQERGTAIAVVRKCTLSNIAAAQNPGDAGAQATAKADNVAAIAGVRDADAQQQRVKALVAEKPVENPISTSSSESGSSRVSYRENTAVNQGRLDTVSTHGASTITNQLQETLQGDQRHSR